MCITQMTDLLMNRNTSLQCSIHSVIDLMKLSVDESKMKINKIICCSAFTHNMCNLTKIKLQMKISL